MPGFFNKYPYTDFHELNLDYILEQMKLLRKAFEDFVGINAITFTDPILWSITREYGKNEVVLDNSGNAYLSLQIIPVGIPLTNTDYWMEIFNFTGFISAIDSNITFNIENNTGIATANYAVDDWLLIDNILYKVIAAISEGDAFIVGTNIEQFTLEQFIRAWVYSCTQLINQYKNDIDASEILYRNQLAGDIADTTASLQAQLDAAISGVTVDSEVINARVGADGVIYPTLGDALRTQVLNYGINVANGQNIRNKTVKDIKLDIFDDPINYWNPDDYEMGFIYQGVITPGASQRTSGYIPVEENDVLQVAYVFPAGTPSADHLAIFTWSAFDENYNFTHGHLATNETSITAQAGDKYVRMSLNNTYFGANVIVYKNMADHPDYMPFMLKIKGKYLSNILADTLIVNPSDVNAYSTINAAVTAAAPGDVIVIYPGTYNEVINTNKALSIIGLDREKCILQSTSPEYADTPLYIAGNVTLENITIKMNCSGPSTVRNGYAIHIDRSGSGINRIRNCTFYNNIGAALGAGGQQNQYTYFEDCTFISDVAETAGSPNANYDGYGAVFFHSPTSVGVTGTGAEFKNCVFQSTLLRVFTLSSIQDQSLMYLTFINCLAYSKYQKKNDVVYYNATTYLKINDMSYGNSTNELNI